MAYVVTAKWTAKEGEEETVLDAIRHLIPRLLADARENSASSGRRWVRNA